MRVPSRVLGTVMLLGAAIAAMLIASAPNTATPAASRHGWAGTELLEETPIRGELPIFQLTPGQCEVERDNATANVQLWKALRILNDGRDPEFEPQQVGDCTAQGAAYAVCVLQAVQIVEKCQPSTWRAAFPPYIYATSRHLVGRDRLKGRDGGLGVWAAEAVRRHGVLSADAAKAPKYSAAIARRWGDEGPPKWAIEAGMRHLVRTIGRVESAIAVRDAICSGYPVTVASYWGTKNYREIDGRIVALGDDRWAHQMCVDGYDGTGIEPWFHIRNSWGRRAHPAPIDHSPAGGFWVSSADVDRMVAAGDSYAFSCFDGFPIQLLGGVCDARSERVAVLGDGLRRDGDRYPVRHAPLGDRRGEDARPNRSRDAEYRRRYAVERHRSGRFFARRDRLDAPRLPAVRAVQNRSSGRAAFWVPLAIAR